MTGAFSDGLSGNSKLELAGNVRVSVVPAIGTHLGDHHYKFMTGIRSGDHVICHEGILLEGRHEENHSQLSHDPEARVESFKLRVTITPREYTALRRM